MTPAEARKILKVDMHATKEEIKKAWRARTMETHPDRNGDIEEFKKVQSAYNRLTQASAITNTIESEILDTIFEEMFHKMGFTRPMETIFNFSQEEPEEAEKPKKSEIPEEKPMRIRKPKYPINSQKQKKP